jgi:Transposase IS116/IS110/IS902 family
MSDTQETKACPWCGETILAVAKKCKHCGEYIGVTDPAPEQPKTSGSGWWREPSGRWVCKDHSDPDCPTCTGRYGPQRSTSRPSSVQRDHLIRNAALCGSSPVQVSSGKTDRHRLNRGGDRHANSALWRIVIVRMTSHQPTKDYIARRHSRRSEQTRDHPLPQALHRPRALPPRPERDRTHRPPATHEHPARCLTSRGASHLGAHCGVRPTLNQSRA